MSRYLDATNDLAFKKVFSDKGIMKDFLNSILGESWGSIIEEIEFIPTEEIPDLGQGKRSIFDLKCRDQEGNWFVIEMQNRKQLHFLERVQFYASHTYVSQLSRGGMHKGLLPVILIAISKEKILPSDVGYISYHKTKEEMTNKQHLFALSYVFIELEKFKKKENELKSIEDYWLYFLANSQGSGEPPVSVKDPFVLKAYDRLERFNWSEGEYDAYIRARLLAEAEEMTLQDNLQNAREEGLKEGEAKGLKEGKEEGLKEARWQIAKSMLEKKSFDLQDISKITGLSIEELNKLK
ncbi:hypothetical protein RFI_29758, partial [Reticulomyxa filosa]